MLNKKQLLIGTAIITIITLITLLLPWQDTLILKILRISFGSLFVLFLPGFWLTKSFFKTKEIDRLERFALSFALSISIVPLLTFYINLIGVKITQMSVWGVVTFVIIANIVYLERNFIKKSILGK